jgi:large-conductance mechanosensitive channel
MNIIAVVGMIVSILVPKWVSGKDPDGDKYFTGSLLKSYDLNFTSYDDDDSYEDLSDDFCDLYDFAKLFGNKISILLFKSFCNMFKNLYRAGRMFVGLEATAAGAAFFWFFTMAIYCNNGKCISFTYLCSCISLLSQIIAIIIYVVLTNTKFGNCDDFPINGDNPELCAEYGLIIALVSLVILAIQIFLFFIVACKVQKQGHLCLSKNPSDRIAQNTNQVLPTQITTKENNEYPKFNQYSNSQGNGRVFRPSAKTLENNSSQYPFTQRRNNY